MNGLIDLGIFSCPFVRKFRRNIEPANRNEEKMPEEKSNGPGRIAMFAAFFGVAVVLLGVSGWIMEFILANDPISTELIVKNFAAIVGLPLAAIGSFIVVVFLEHTTDGPLEFEGFGFKFKGASGPVVLWVLCFLAIAGMIKLLWVP